jgi:glyoxylase-like metal-dependent hydrolase (beta-lactamase superfamily II)
MADDLVFDTAAPPEPGPCVALSPLVRRIVAGNGGPVTYTGTCSYIVGRGRVAVIDPGPDLPEHLDALLAALGAETVTHIVVSHTHKDHSPSARLLKAATGARIVGCSAHRTARVLSQGEANPLEASTDRDYAPDEEMREGDTIAGPGWRLTASRRPGHMATTSPSRSPRSEPCSRPTTVMALEHPR